MATAASGQQIDYDDHTPGRPSFWRRAWRSIAAAHRKQLDAERQVRADYRAWRGRHPRIAMSFRVLKWSAIAIPVTFVLALIGLVIFMVHFPHEQAVFKDCMANLHPTNHVACRTVIHGTGYTAEQRILALRRRGDHYFSRSDFARTIMDYEAADRADYGADGSRLFYRDPAILNRLGDAYYYRAMLNRQGDLKQYSEGIVAAIDLYERAYFNVLHDYENQKRSNASSQQYNKDNNTDLFKIKPVIVDTSALENLFIVYTQIYNSEHHYRGLAYLWMAMDMDAENPERLGRAHYLLGNYYYFTEKNNTRALAEWSETIRIRGNQAPYSLRQRANLYERLGMKDKAIADWQLRATRPDLDADTVLNLSRLTKPGFEPGLLEKWRDTTSNHRVLG